MPTRHQFAESDVYANLDQLISDPLPFRLHGKVHLLKPVELQEFYSLTNALMKLHALRDDASNINTDQLIDSYFKVINSVCGTITKQDIEQMTQAQIGALYALILEHASGRSHKVDHEELKKKTFHMLSQT